MGGAGGRGQTLASIVAVVSTLGHLGWPRGPWSLASDCVDNGEQCEQHADCGTSPALLRAGEEHSTLFTPSSSLIVSHNTTLSPPVQMKYESDQQLMISKDKL